VLLIQPCVDFVISERDVLGCNVFLYLTALKKLIVNITRCYRFAWIVGLLLVQTWRHLPSQLLEEAYHICFSTTRQQRDISRLCDVSMHS
jgi:hypothetical protein